MARGPRPGKINVRKSLDGLRINQGITSAMLPHITFEPTLGITARRIDKLGMDIRSFREPLRRSIKEVVAPSIVKNFDSSGRPTWEPFAEATPTIQERIQGYNSHPLLIRSGLLRSTMGQLNIWTINTDSAILTGVPESIWYAKVQQAGYSGSGKKRGPKGKNLQEKKAQLKSLVGSAGTTNAGANPIPARPFVMLQEEDVKNIGRVFEKWLGERIDRTWGH